MNLDDQDLEGQKILLRTDLNLPLRNGEPQKTLRYQRYMESLEKIQETGAKTVVLAHQGRPGREDFTSLKDHQELIEEDLGQKVFFVQSFMGSELADTLDEMDSGDIALVENIRMMSEELKNYSAEKHSKDLYVKNMAESFDLFVNDAFSVAHRSQASIVGFPELLKSVKGPLMKSETENCRKVRDEFDSGVLVLGGEKPSDLIGIIKSNIDSVEKVLLGGVPGELALMAQGHELGEKEEWVRERGLDKSEQELKELIEEYGEKFEIPSDLKTEDGVEDVENLSGQMTWDIGDETAERYAEIIENADSVLMKGPMGAFEDYPEGTREIIEALERCNGFTVMGGGHTSSLVEEFGYSMNDFSHVSIAGGAFVKYVSGGELPGLEALK